MYTTYQLNSNDLTPEFIEIIKTTFKDKEIEIAVYSIDETEYLLHSPKNKEILLRRIADIKNNINVITPNQEIFQ